MYEREVDHIAAQRRLVAPAVGVGEKLLGTARGGIERGDWQPVGGTAREPDTPFQDDLELQLLVAHLQERADAVAVRDDRARELERTFRDPAEGCLAHGRAQFAIALAARAQEIHVRGFPVFVERQHDARAAAEPALRPLEKARVQRGEGVEHGSMAGPRRLRH